MLVRSSLKLITSLSLIFSIFFQIPSAISMQPNGLYQNCECEYNTPYGRIFSTIHIDLPCNEEECDMACQDRLRKGDKFITARCLKMAKKLKKQ